VTESAKQIGGKMKNRAQDRNINIDNMEDLVFKGKVQDHRF